MKKIVFLILTCGLIFACGYRFSLQEVEGKRAGIKRLDINTVYIYSFVNKTQRRGIENLLQNALVYEFSTGEGPKLVKKDEAEAFLQGEILNYQETSVAYTRQEYAVSGKVSLAVRVVLMDKNGQIFWENPHLFDQESFAFGQTPSQTEDNKKQAIRRILQRMAERIYEVLRVQH
jgi:hypothetical protein